jgi:hypothetical protein
MEPFNGYKDELFGVVLHPTKTLNGTINYYLGQEHPDFGGAAGRKGRGSASHQVGVST